MQRFVDAALKPKVSWKDVMRRFVSSKAKTEASFAKPKRRWLGEDLYLPSLSGEKLGEVVFFIDTSGSIGPKELSEFGAEVIAAHADCHPDKLHIVYFDSQVVHHDIFVQDDEVHLAPHGGGGTAFSPCIQYLIDKDIDPVCAVFLTDLCCSDFGPAPHYPVLWVSTERGTAPWGEVVLMNEKL
jgi:predicted metal-dependent peptidase